MKKIARWNAKGNIRGVSKSSAERSSIFGVVEKLKRNCDCLLLFRLALAVLCALVLAGEGAASAGGPSEPTTAEREMFRAKLQQLIDHTEHLPYLVDEVIRSLSDTVRIVFDCPDGYRVERVEIAITTKQIRWNRSLTLSDQVVETPAEAAGYYIWQPSILIANNRKRVVATNWVMLDTSFAPPGRARLPFPEATILYHEFLHGQLQIDAMFDRDWQLKSCVCEFDAEPSDGAHQRIPGFIHAYLKSVSNRYSDVFAIDVPPQHSLGANGRFIVPFADLEIMTGSGGWETIFYYPERSNIDPLSLNIEARNKKVVARGLLTEKGKRGFMLIYFKSRK